MKLVVGLGNPGDNHKNDRHNVGFALLDKLCFEREVKLRENRKFKAMEGVDSFGIRYLKPLTYMNASGNSVQMFAEYYRIDPELILVIHDELDLLAGEIKLKRGGGTGGHNGLRSIEQHLSSKDYCRIRIGIGRPRRGQNVTSYVLNPPNQEQSRAIDTGAQRVVEHINVLLLGCFDRAMNILNQRIMS